jgi:hypothetical protein
MFETTIISSAQIEVRGRADYFAKAALNALEQALADPILIVKVTDMDGNSRTYEVSKKGPGPVARLVS